LSTKLAIFTKILLYFMLDTYTTNAVQNYKMVDFVYLKIVLETAFLLMMIFWRKKSFFGKIDA